MGLIPGLGESPEGRHGNPRQYSCQENPTDREVWWSTSHRVTKSWTRLKGLSTHTQLQHSGSSIFIAACGIHLPYQGSNLSPLHWELGTPATGQPGKTSP